MSQSLLDALKQRATDASSSSPCINAVMLITWPKRREMIQHAIHSFVLQTYDNRVLTIVNDGAPCRLSEAFRKTCQGSVVTAPEGATIGEKRNLATAAVAEAEFIASFDDDDFSVPWRLRTQLVGSSASER